MEYNNKYMVADLTAIPANQAEIILESKAFSSLGPRVLAKAGEMNRIAHRAVPA